MKIKRITGGMIVLACLVCVVHARAVEKEVFSDDFEQDLGKWKPGRQGDVKFQVDDRKCSGGTHSVRVEVNGQYPSTYGTLGVAGIPVEENKNYLVTFRYFLEGVKENALELGSNRRPAVPNVRIQFLDKEGRLATLTPDGKPDTSKYVWFGAPFENGTAEWKEVRNIFRTPEKSASIKLTIFFWAEGKYWLDDVRITEYE